MNILITFYQLNNLGGIILNNESLVAGLQALGHKVVVRLLLWKYSERENARTRRLEAETAASGIPFDQELGWKWPVETRFAYRGKQNLTRWKEFACRFDLIIWQIPVPTMNRDNEGNSDWPELYNVDVPQVAYVHDGNLVDSYPWISMIMDKLTGAIGVHPCAYHSLQYLPVPRACAFSPQMNIAARIAAADKAKARSGWVSLQTFKQWKHVDDLVRAVPYMRNKEAKHLAGGGIHYYYMTSKDKLRPEYLASRLRDPDMSMEWDGRRIWELAVESGMVYHDYLITAKRDRLLNGARFLIDPSWSKKYSSIGDHFNRTSVEGLISGCVPIARNLGMTTNEKGVGEFFVADTNYKMIPWNATPKEFAEAVDACINMKESAWRDLLENGRELLPYFDYRKTAQAFIDLAEGKPAGVYKRKHDRGTLLRKMVYDGRKAFDSFFAGGQSSQPRQTSLFE